jgi:hypothetical protein
VKALLLAALLAPGAAAINVEAPGAPALRMRDAVEALPVEARVELRRMFLRYREEVANRTDQGWSPGLLSDAVIEGVDDPFQPARLLEEADQARQKELADLQASLAKTGADSRDYSRLADKLEAKRIAADGARRKNVREKGICRDWSDDVWSELTKMNLEQWTVDDRRRTARPFHTGAVACSPPDSATVCLVFDPWSEGKASVYAFPAWDAKQPGGRLPAEYFLHGLPEKAP